MKKRVVGVLTVCALLFSACSNEKDYYDPDKALELKEALYEYAFTVRYGQIAADQDWGFGDANNMKSVRTANPNSNQWSEYVNVPTAITETERAEVVKWFEEHQYPESISLNWSDFFVQYVDGKHSNMDWLFSVLENGTMDHMYNFNATKGATMLMQNSGTAAFGFHSSQDSKEHLSYTIQYINGAYYVGFDYVATGQNSNQQEPANGYYDDWIVKITPAVYKNTERIIAEDLGATDDFDFNDVVFDVALLNDGTVITLQAAGGTLPLYIQVGDEGREVHELFGVSTSTMVNTEGISKAPVIFRLPKCERLNDVQILVESTTAGSYHLKANCGKAPQKICVPVSYVWTEERVSIETAYPKFKDWVGNTRVNWLE